MQPTLIRPTAPHFSVAGVFLEYVARQDFPGLRAAVTDDVRLRALLPGGNLDVVGADEFTAAFAWWFRDLSAAELVDGTVGEVGQRLHLRWRIRVLGGRFPDWHVIEQQAYADVAENGRIAALSLLCSGFQPENVVLQAAGS